MMLHNHQLLYAIIPWLFQAEDLLGDLLSFESSSLASDSFKTSDGSLTTTEVDIKNESAFLSDAELHALAKDRQKKDNHNLSELLVLFFIVVPDWIVFFQLSDEEDLI